MAGIKSAGLAVDPNPGGRRFSLLEGMPWDLESRSTAAAAAAAAAAGACDG